MEDTEWREEAEVAVQLLGGLRLWLGGEEIDLTGKSRSRLLLAYLAFPVLRDGRGRLLSQAARRVVNRDDLLRDIWPEDVLGERVSTRSGDQSRLRRLVDDLHNLSTPEGRNLGKALISDSRGVSLHAVTDIDSLPSSLNAVRETDPSPAQVQALLAALRLFRGELLPGLEAPWIASRRERLATLYADAVDRLAGLLPKYGSPGIETEALQSLGNAWAMLRPPTVSPERCDACAVLRMRLHLRAGDPTAALTDYARIEQTWKPYGREPSAEARALRSQAKAAAHAAAPLRQRRPLIGRDDEVGSLERLLLARPPLVTLTGPPGVGKTRLCQEMAARLWAQWAGAVHVVELQHLDDPHRVLAALARTLSVPPDEPDVLQHIAEALERTPSLLVLDNCEHLIAPQNGIADIVRDLLRQAPTLTCLATSRMPLGLDAETEFRLAPLAVPAETDSLDAVLACPSVQLFLTHVPAAAKSFRVGPRNAAVVARLCRLLDGLPLALALVASRVGGYSLATMLSELNVLRSQPSPRPRRERHLTLEAAVRWSYALLTPEQAGVLRRLAVFRSGCSLEAAVAVCADTGGNVAAALGELAAHSLVEAEDSAGPQPRLRLLETVRAFAWDRLREVGEDNAACAAHARYFLGLTEASAIGLTGPAAEPALVRVRQEAENLHAALTWCLREQGEAETGIRLAIALYPVWEVSSDMGAARTWYEAALDRLTPDGDAFLTARTHTCLGVMAWRQSDHSEARAHHEQGLALFRSLRHESSIAIALHNLGLVAKYEGDYATAEQRYQESLEIRRRLGERHNVAKLLVNLGNVAQEQGDLDTAASRLEEAMPLLREVGTPDDIGRTLNNLGNVRVYQGQSDAAHSLFAEALAIQRKLGNRLSTAICLLNLAQLSLHFKELIPARDWLAECLELAQEIGDRDTLSCALAACADLARTQGNLQCAARLCGVVEAMRRDIGSPFSPIAQIEWEKSQSAIRDTLGIELFEAEFAIGKTLDWEKVVRPVLEKGNMRQ